MNVSLTPQLEARTRQKVESGQYGSADEVVNEALQLLEERDRRQRLRDAIAVAGEQFARGEFTVWDADSLSRLMQEADEDERQGLPISDDVLP